MSVTAMTEIKMPGLHIVPKGTDKDDISTMKTMLIEPDRLAEWKRPIFQRPFVKTKRVEEIVGAMQLEAAKDPREACAIIEGVVTLGIVGKDTYLVDGQHRLGSFALAAKELMEHGGVLVRQALVDVRVRRFDSLKDMADAFINLNSQLNPTKPDDIMRSLAASNEYLAEIAEKCPFVGYDLTGANKKIKLLSMSSAIRTWFGSGGIVPANGPSALEIVRKYLDRNQADMMMAFYGAAMEAGWAHEPFKRLWGSLNLGINMWIYRRTVLGETMRFGQGGHKPMVLTREQYIVCMRSLMEPEYMDWLVGRQLRFQDRNPCYAHIREHFTVALKQLGVEAPRFPQAQWG